MPPKSSRSDDYANLVTGLGGPVDKSQHGFFQRERRLWEPELNNMYEGSGLAARIIDRVVDDSTREGFRLEGSDKTFPWVEVASEVDDLGVVKVANKAAKTARLYGGGLLVMLTRDPGSMEDELDLKNVSKLEGFQVFPSSRVIPDAYNSSFGTEAYSNPEWYLLSSPNGSQTRVHRSRCIRVEGVPVLSPYRAMERGGWGPSVLERVAGELARLEAAEGYAAGCMHDISVLTLKMPSLHAMTCGSDDQQAEAKKILEGIFWLRDNFHATLLDSEDSIEEVKRDLSGFGPLIEIFTSAVIREENMPRTILLGEQPGGLGSSSSDEVRGWYDHCAGWQERFLTPIYKRIMEVYFAVRANNNLPVPTKWVIAYDSLWQPDAQTQAQTLLTSAQAYQLLILTGVMTKEQVRYEMIQKGLIKEGIEIPGLPDPEEISPVDPSLEDPPLEAPLDDESAMASSLPLPPDLCSVREAASKVGIPTVALSRACRRGELPYWGFGNHMQVSLSDVLAMGKAHEVEVEPAGDERVYDGWTIRST